MQGNVQADTGNKKLATKRNHKENKPDTYWLFPLLWDNRQQQEHRELSIPGNQDGYHWLNQRSQKRSYSWKEYNDMLKVYPIVPARIYVSVYA